METKKSPKANLETKRSLYFEFGMFMSLALVLFAFEWKTSNTKSVFTMGGEEIVAMDQIVNTNRKEELVKPKPRMLAVDFHITSDPVLSDSLFFAFDLPFDTVIEYYFDEKPIADDTDDVIVAIPEIAPEFPGGERALLNFMKQNIEYPSIDIENRTQGTVYVQFVVMRDGSIGNVKTLRSLSPTADNEAMRVVKMLPKWKPARMGTREVSCIFNLPVNFKLVDH